MWHDLGWGGVLRGKAHMSGVGLLPAQPLCRLGMPMCLGQHAMANLFRRRCWSCRLVRGSDSHRTPSSI
jgi:hypothetical protein